MFSKLVDRINIIIGKTVMPGWVDIVNMSGTKMIARNLKMKDENIKCIGLCSSYAVIYSSPYEKTMRFIDKPQHYIIVVNEQSLWPHMDENGTKEVLEAYRRVCLMA